MKTASIRVIALIVVSGVLLFTTIAQGDMLLGTYGFNCITNNNPVNAATGQNQLSVEVWSYGANQVKFLFGNAGPLACSIADVYFDDGTLLALSSIIEGGAGVQFSQNATPGDLPGGNNLSPKFVTSQFDSLHKFSADSDPPVQPNGVNPGEWLGIVFDLQSGKTPADTIAALGLGGADGGLRIGIHVQGFSNGGSESFVNGPPIPAPAALLLGAFGLGLVGWAKKRLM